MEKAVEKAVGGSIGKWIYLRFAPGTLEFGTTDCPLCTLFHKELPDGESNCSGCPIHERTGKHFCVGTPYIDWANHQDTHEYVIGSTNFHRHEPGCSTCEQLIDGMVVFLKSL